MSQAVKKVRALPLTGNVYTPVLMLILLDATILIAIATGSVGSIY
jgi:hypothetical protein